MVQSFQTLNFVYRTYSFFLNHHFMSKNVNILRVYCSLWVQMKCSGLSLVNFVYLQNFNLFLGNSHSALYGNLFVCSVSGVCGSSFLM